MKKGLGLLFFLLCVCTTNLVAQVPLFTEEQARVELEKRGLDEEEFAARMLEKGVDIYNINPETLTPFEIDRLERLANEVISEMEQEKIFDIEDLKEEGEKDEDKDGDKKEKEGEEKEGEEKEEDVLSKIKKLPRSMADEIEKRVKEGETLEEALDEVIKEEEGKEGEEEEEEEPEEEDEEELAINVYGQQIFRNRELDLFIQSTDLSPPDSYVLGVGDKIAVSIWGSSVLQKKYEISETGYIRPSQMRPVLLKGLTLKRAKKLLQNTFQQRYRFLPEQFDITLDYARTITINILGDVLEPGSYSIPALNTAVNALIAAGGPNDIGSLRKVQLIRSGEAPRILDLYEFLQNPLEQDKFFLQNNDNIFVPVADKIVEIEGGIKRPLKYELIDTENLIELIDYAGGLVDSAYQSNIQINRFSNDEQQIIDVNLKELYENNGNFPLVAGDRINIKTIPKPYENFVMVNGEVLIPGKFQLTKDMRVNELVNRAVLRKEARTDRVFLKRFQADSTMQYLTLNLDSIINFPNTESNIRLFPKDELMIYSKSLYADKGTVTVRGAVRTPVELPLDASGDLTLEEAIMFAGGLDPEAYSIGYLKRKDPNNNEQLEWKRFNVKDALENPSSEDNFSLMPLDTIEILANPTFTDQYEVRVAGAVRNAGDFQYDETLTLKDVLTLAGGLKLEAASNQIEIFRLVIRENQPTQTIVATVEVDESLNVPIGGEFPLAPFDLIVVRSVPDFELFQTVAIDGEVQYPGPYALLDKNERLLSIIERAGGLTEEAFPAGSTLYRELDSIGYVVMELEDVLQDKDSRYNFILKEGDRIMIPKQEDLVTIQGELRVRELYPDKYIENGRVNTAYHSGKRASFYINRYAAGVGENGKRGLVTVEHPNGRIEKTADLLLFRVYPKVQKGSIINVGKKPPKDLDREQRELDREPVDWGQVLADSIGQAGSIISLVLLIQRL